MGGSNVSCEFLQELSALVQKAVYADNSDNQRSGGGFLEVGIHAGVNQQLGNKIKKEGAKDCANEGTFAAENVRAAEHNGTDHLQLEAKCQAGWFDRLNASDVD